MKITRNQLCRWIFALIWMAVIFFFSAQDAGTSSETSGLPAEILANIVQPNIDTYAESERLLLLNQCQFAVRKFAHFSVYAVLGVLVLNAFRTHEKISFKIQFTCSTVLCLLYAAGDELHQYFVPGRSCQFRDVLIDFSGTLAGILIASLFLKIIQRYRKKKRYHYDPN